MPHSPHVPAAAVAKRRLFAVAALLAPLAYAPAALAADCVSGVAYTNSTQPTVSTTQFPADCTVPAGVTSMSVVVIGGGGGGGTGANAGAGGSGAKVTVTNFPVTAGATLYMRLGSGGIGGYANSSSGGGIGGYHSSIYTTNTTTVSTIATGGGIVAGGGGGGGMGHTGDASGGAGGSAGGANGAGGNGSSGSITFSGTLYTQTGGTGGANGTGGTGGTGVTNGTNGDASTGGFSGTGDKGGRGGSGYGGGGGGGSGGTGALFSGGGGGGGGSIGPSTGGASTTYESANNGGTSGPVTSGGGAGGNGSVTLTFVITNAAPVASNVAVTGGNSAQVGTQLSGTYTYSDAESDAQGTSTFRWVRQSNPTVDVATTQNYTPVIADVGNALKFCVTPVASAGTSPGTEVCSSATANVVAAPANGACGTAGGTASAYAPSANLCSNGSAGAVSIVGNNWSWTCSGTNGGNASPTCTAPFAATQSGGVTGAIQAATTNNWQVRTADSGFVAPPAAPPAGVTMPNGATKVVLDSGTAGTSATVTLRFSSIPAGAQLYKYGKETGIGDTPHWFAYPATIDYNAGTVTYTLTDGQKGDNDWTANGVIDDPVGLGVGAGGGVEGVPTLSEWAMALLAGFMLLVGARQVRRRH